MQEGTQTEGLPLELGEVAAAEGGRLEVRQDIIDVGDDLVLTEPQAVDLSLHGHVRVVVSAGLHRGRGRTRRTEHLSELVDEAVRHTLPVEVRLSHRPVDTIEGIVVPLE